MNKLEIITEYYRQIDEYKIYNGKMGKITEVGLFIPSTIDRIYPALERLVRKNIINKKGEFWDFGCGDGRILAIMAGVFGIPCGGIEYDHELVENAKDNITDLGEKIGKLPIKLVEGNFLMEKIDFEQIQVIYNYVNNWVGLGKRIKEQARKGTKYIVYGLVKMYRLEGLIKISSNSPLCVYGKI